MKFSQSARFFSSQLIFDFRHCEWAAYSRGVNLHSVHSFSIHRGVQMVSRAIRKTRHPHLPMLAVLCSLYRSCIQGCRFFAPVSSRHFTFFCPTTRCGKIHRGWGKQEKEKNRVKRDEEKSKQELSLSLISNGVLRHVMGCYDTLIP